MLSYADNDLPCLMQMGADVVALKVPRPGRRREGFGRALAKEANMLCGLRHRNVLGCFGVMRWGRVLVRCVSA